MNKTKKQTHRHREQSSPATSGEGGSNIRTGRKKCVIKKGFYEITCETLKIVMHSSPPERAPKSQLAVEEPSKGGWLEPTPKDNEETVGGAGMIKSILDLSDGRPQTGEQ